LASSDPQIQPNRDTQNPKRVRLNGFSIIPPTGLWTRVGSDAESKELAEVGFRKQIGNSTYVLNAFLSDLEGSGLNSINDVLSGMKTASKFRESPRQRNMRSTFSIVNILDTACVRFDMQAEDTQPWQKAGSTYDIDSHGLYCLHPITFSFLAGIEYSRRTPKGTPHVGDPTEGEAFLKSLQFTVVSR